MEVPPPVEQKKNHKNPTKKQLLLRGSVGAPRSVCPHLAILYCQFPIQLNDKPSIQMKVEHLNNCQEQSEHMKASAVKVPVSLT